MHFTGSSGCLWKLLALFILVPLAELWLLLVLARHTSVWTALLVVMVTGVAGTLLVKAQGWRTMRRITEELQQGRLPTDALLDAAMIFWCRRAAAHSRPADRRAGNFLADSLLPAPLSSGGRGVDPETHATSSPGPGLRPNARSEIVDAYVIDPPDDKRPPRQ